MEMDIVPPNAPTFLGQFKALMRKNYLIKNHSRKLTAVEVLFPMYFVIILFVISSAIPAINQHFEAVSSHPVIPVPPLLASLCNPGPCRSIGLAPDQTSLQGVVSAASALLTAAGASVRIFPDESQLLEYYKDNPGTLFGAIVFNEIGNGAVFDYTIRVNGTSQTAAITYANGGALALQILAQKAILKQVLPNGATLPSVSISTKQFPTHSSSFSWNISLEISGIYFLFSFMQIVHQYVSILVTDKHTKVKEGLKIMGCSSVAYTISWFTTQTIIGFVSIILLLVLGWILGLFAHSNLFLLFILFALYFLTLLNIAAVLSVFIENPKVAGGVNFLVFLIVTATYAICRFYLFAKTPEVPPDWEISMLSLVPGVPFGHAMLLVNHAEFIKKGVQWDDLDLHMSEVYSLRLSLLWLFIDFLIYGFLAWYLDKIHPGEYGVPRPFYFLFTRSYWREVFDLSTSKANSVYSDFHSSWRRFVDWCLYINQEGEESPQAPPEQGGDVLIQNLTKVFTKGIKMSGPLFSFFKAKKSVVAVDNLNVTLKRGEIFCLLGHNGAGKTTAISLLTGMMPPTSGTAIFQAASGENLDIRKHMEIIRKSLGVCPQYDVLFPKLTARQHLRLYANLKGVHPEAIPQAIREAILEVGLGKDVDTLVEGFSGGMKRKLSVAIAFIANPSVVFLDEPTSGMDPMSRRKIWSVLQKHKKSKIIVLTTHSMEEADLLGDTIAIMSHGRLECLGSSLSLKLHYGIGYHLTLEKSSHEANNHDAVSQFISKYIQGFELLTNHGSELVFTLPLSAVTSFPRFMADLESPQTMTRLSISSFGLSMTTLEEVFLKIAEKSAHQES